MQKTMERVGTPVLSHTKEEKCVSFILIEAKGEVFNSLNLEIKVPLKPNCKRTYGSLSLQGQLKVILTLQASRGSKCENLPLVEADKKKKSVRKADRKKAERRMRSLSNEPNSVTET